MDGIKKLVFIGLALLFFMNLAAAQLMPFTFPCSYSSASDEGGDEDGEVALSISIHGNPSHYIPQDIYQVTLSSSSDFTQVQVIGLYESSTTQDLPQLSAFGLLSPASSVCTMVHQYHSLTAQRHSTFLWMAPPAGTGCINFMVTAVSYQHLLFKDVMALQLCETGMPTPSPFRPQLAMIHSDGVILRDDFDSSPELDYTIWSEIYGGNISDTCGSVLHGKSAVFCDSFGQRELNTVHLNTTTASALQFAISSGHCRPGTDDYSITISYAVHTKVDWHIIDKIRAPSDGSTSIHIVHLPLAARTEEVSLRFHQDLAMDAHHYRGCWALDNVLITNLAHRPTSLQEDFDPVDPTSWLFFPNGAIQEKCQSRGNTLYFHGEEEKETNEYQFVTSQDLNLWQDIGRPGFSEGFETMDDLNEWEVSGAEIGQMCDIVHTNNSLVMNGLDERQVCTPYLNTSNMGNLRFYYIMGGGSCDPADSEQVQVSVYAQVSGHSSPVLLHILPHDSHKKPQLVSVALPPTIQSPSTKFCLSQPRHNGLNRNVWAIDDLVLLPTHPTHPMMHLQFSLNLQCGSEAEDTEVRVEFSTDMGRSWSLVRQECLPGVCDGVMTPDDSVYSTGDFSGKWRRVTIPLSTAALMKQTRFRWRQNTHDSSNTKWAVDNVYIGDACGPVMCNGHGRCTHLGCRCDQGYSGVNCQISVSDLLGNLTEKFETFTPEFDEHEKFSVIQGGSIGYGCGVLASGKALVFNQQGRRELITQEINTTNVRYLQFTVRIGSHGSSGSCSPAVNASESVLVLSSCDNGIHWNLIKVMEYNAYRTARAVLIHLNPVAKGDACMIRWWQPSNGGENQGVWALDDIAMTMTLRNNINLDFSDHREVRRALTFHTGQIGEACNIGPALVLPGQSHSSGASILETQSLQVGASFMIQFYLAVGCGQQRRIGHNYSINLEYSTDHGLTWHDVVPSCMPGDVGCATYRQGSQYHSTEYTEWTRISLPLPARLRFSVTRFRLRQSHHVDGATWAIRHLYVGEQCPDMCHGHGVCQEGICSCDRGYSGANCLPDDPRLNAIQSNFEDASAINADWTIIQGASIKCTGHGCGTVSSGCSLYFHGPGVRQLVSHDMSTVEPSYIQFYIEIGSDEGRSACRRATERSEGVLLQYSIDGGVSWVDLLELYYQDYTMPRFVRKELPPGAQSPATRFRWRQPRHAGAYTSQWAIDDIFIGNDFRLQSLEASFVNDSPLPDIWMSTSSGQVGTFCGSRGPALYFDAVGEDRFAVTRSMQLTTRDVVQFKVVVGCQEEFSHFAPVYLEKSTDGGMHWELVTTPCYPFSEGEIQCDGQGGELRDGSIYHSGKYNDWGLIVIPVQSEMTHSNVQFRWWQAGDPLAPAFGLDDVYIGQSCPGHCSGHGVCRNGDCECDSGYHGLSCTPKGSNPHSFIDGFDAMRPQSDGQWSHTLGADVGQGCGIIKMDNSLYFSSTGPREAQTDPVNTTSIKIVQFYVQIGSIDQGDRCMPAIDRSEAVIVQYSNNSGIMWHMLKVLDPTQLGERSTQVTINLPQGAKTPDTVFRWWQPFVSLGMPRAQWALDNIVIGANETRSYGFEDTFTDGASDSWYMTMGGQAKPYCGAQQALVFDSSLGVPRYTETWDFHVTMTAFLQFELTMGCGGSPSSPSYAVMLEYSLDMGQTWHLVSEACSPPDMGCGRYGMGSVYLSQMHLDWTRVTVYLPEAAISTSTRFRWHQPDFRNGRDVWAIDNIYLGSGCPWMCSGHGHCKRGNCVCDPGYSGSFCVPSIPLSKQLKDSFDGPPRLDTSRWLSQYGMIQGSTQCDGVLVSGNAAIFNQPGVRMLVAQDVDATMMEYIQFIFKYSCYDDPSATRSSAVLLQYSINGGITWELLQELPFTPLPPTFFNIKLPMLAKTNSTRFRFWQPQHSHQGNTWALDNLIIGGNFMTRGPLQESFDLVSINNDDWLFYPGATTLTDHCPQHPRQGVSYLPQNPYELPRGSGHSYQIGQRPSLVFPQTIGEHSVTTRDIDVDESSILQFEINVGCSNQSSATHPVRLEVSRDYGTTWSLLSPDCFSNQSTCLSCSEHLTTPTVYYSGENERWVRYTILLSRLHVCGTVRFRWYQGFFTAQDNPKQWAIDGIYIGPGCPFNCNGHGSCDNGFMCQCDPGYGGQFCHVLRPNPFFLKESFESSGPLNRNKFSQWSGAEVTKKCGILITGKSLHFTGSGRRMLTTVDMDLTMASIISFYIRLGCSQHPPSLLNLPIILQSSSDGGITWDTIEEMTFDPQSNDPMYVALQLPVRSHSNATRIRWWQPSREGVYMDEWAIDQIFIGGYIHGQTVLEDDFMTSLQNDGDQNFSLHDQNWLISPGSTMGQVCDVTHNALHFASNEQMRYTITSDVMVTDHTFLQFDIALGCNQQESCYGILLEYSLDMGKTWNPLLTECFPSQVECTGYHMRSVYLADIYYGWNRVTLPLPQYTRSKSTRFRWSQPPRFDPGHEWALSNVYIGSECSDMCNGHGQCSSGICICDQGWTGPSCQRPSVRLPQSLRDTFSAQPVSGRGHWSKVIGAMTSESCGPVASGTYLHFTKSCSRQLVTSDFDLTHADYIQFYFRFGCLNPPQHRDEGVLLEYSLDGGITWTLLLELYHHQYQRATFVSLPLPPEARHNGTRLKWWQPSHSGPDTADWAIDNVFIGGSATLPHLLRDSFLTENVRDHWLFSDNADLGEFCSRNAGLGDTGMQPRRGGVSWIGGIDSAESSSLTSHDMILKKGDALEFKISIGCNTSWDSPIQPIQLVYSTDHGLTWSLVTQTCLPSDPSCGGHVTLPSILFPFNGWRRLVIPLTEKMTGRPIRFRWYQGASSSPHPSYQQWALDDIRIGQPCSLMCSGHGSCDHPACICDPGFHGDSCEESSGLPTQLKEEVVGSMMSPRSWPLIQGGVITKGSSEQTCGVLRESRSLYFSGSGARLAMASPLDLRDARFIQFYIVIGSEQNAEHCLTATSRLESVMLQYSTDGGISWTLLKELYYQQYQVPRLVYIVLPFEARTHATQFRWWQPLDITKVQAQWALDNILIGGSEINPSSLSESFEHSHHQNGLWEFYPYGQRQQDVCHQRNTALFWENERNAAFDNAATTRQLIVDKNYMIQFKIVVGCQSTPSCNLEYGIVLEYTTDPHQDQWTLLKPACLPGDEEDVRCDPFSYHDNSSYTENEYHQWHTVTMELPMDAVSSSTQFRWIQQDASSLAPSWAVDDVYIGEKCPNMCSGHGQCVEGPLCVCDQGYEGESCTPSMPLPTYFRYGVDRGLIPSMDPWSEVSGGGEGHGCGPLTPHAHGMALYFSGCGLRQAVTVELDTRLIVEIGFVLQIGSRDPNNTACHINYSSPNIRSKAILLQYTLDNGIHWYLIQSHTPRDYGEPTRVSYDLPPEARGVGVRFRWWQPRHDGVNQDQWALDNVDLVSFIRKKRSSPAETEAVNKSSFIF
ncbi:reelin-like [Lytechinus variegatus]|uniref:reelin-like n=1 Tax=Lytechinus variegatus TaxID=7654 RepID=UPI001BB1A7E6|nr:reelin-like [Lytechinus variegatus]